MITEVTPNPSIEWASNSGLRPLSSVAHVKRWTAAGTDDAFPVKYATMTTGRTPS